MNPLPTHWFDQGYCGASVCRRCAENDAVRIIGAFLRRFGQ